MSWYFLHCTLPFSYFARELCGSTVMVTFCTRDLQERCLQTLYIYYPTAVDIPSLVFCAHILHGNSVVWPLWSLVITVICRSGFFGHLSSIDPPRFIGPLLSCVLVLCTGTVWFDRYVNCSWPLFTGAVSSDTLTFTHSPLCLCLE